jgi:sulfur-oxidizing protein SoxZ
MAEPMRIRATVNGGLVEVRVLVRHDMESGQRKDASDKIVPAHFIQTLVARCNGKVVLDAQMGTAVSKDPLLSFKFKGGAKGDKLSITWQDSKGATRTDEAVIG